MAPVPAPLLYPLTEPLRCHTLAVSGGHVLHVEEFGAADGVPALVLHGGPGSGCTPLLRRFFDPQRYRILCPDQRGAGRSQPRGQTAHNTTAELLADLRLLRQRLGIARWLVVGGSWGATLALAHAADVPEAVAGLLLRSTFLARPEDITGFFRGAPQHFHLAETVDARLALAWWQWEHTQAGTTAPEPAGEALAALIDRYRVQAHYLRHACWFDAVPVLDRCAQCPQVPTLLLHGTADRVCPPAGAQRVAARLPASRLQWIDGVGHDPTHPAMAAAMVAALDRFASHGDFAMSCVPCASPGRPERRAPQATPKVPQ